MAPFTLRKAELTDAQVLVDLRIAYLRELEGLPDDVDLDALAHATRRYFIRKMPSGEYVSWVATARIARVAWTRAGQSHRDGGYVHRGSTARRGGIEHS